MSAAPTGLEHATPVRIRDTSATERAGFRKCRRQWFLAVVHRLTPQEPSTALFLGTVYHAGLEAYYRAQKDGRSVAEREQAALDAYQVAFDQGLAVVQAEMGWVASVGLPEFRDAGELGFAMLQNYLEQERETPLFSDVVAVEFRVRVPVTSPSGRRVGWLSVQTDAVGHLPDTGELAVADHKTAKGAVPSAHLDLDDQLTAEVFSWWQHSGEFPTRAVYNVSYKRDPQPPKVLKNGSLSKAKNQLTTPKLYLAEIHKHGLNVADYTDILSHLQELEDNGESRLFRRETTFRTWEQMSAFARDLYEEFRDMKSVALHPERAYPNPTAMNCQGCPVRTVCTTIQDDGDVETIIRSGYVVADPRR